MSKEVNFGTELSPERRTITPQEWLDYFESFLSMRCILICTEMWESSSVMRDYFAGKEVSFSTKEVLR